MLNMSLQESLIFKNKICKSNSDYERFFFWQKSKRIQKGQTTQLKKTFSHPLKSIKKVPETFHLPIFVSWKQRKGLSQCNCEISCQKRIILEQYIVLKGLLNFNSSVNIWTYLSQNQLDIVIVRLYEPETGMSLLIVIVCVKNYKMLAII